MSNKSDEIIRCKDCKFSSLGFGKYKNKLFCEELAQTNMPQVDEDDFCSWAERKPAAEKYSAAKRKEEEE